jgi:hypothetical protein
MSDNAPGKAACVFNIDKGRRQRRVPTPTQFRCHRRLQ